MLHNKSHSPKKYVHVTQLSQVTINLVKYCFKYFSRKLISNDTLVASTLNILFSEMRGFSQNAFFKEK